MYKPPTREDLDAAEGEEEFLAAVLEDVEQNETRLVYADWLEEHGDPVKSSYLRLEIEAHEILSEGRLLSEELRLKLLDESLRLSLAWTALVTRARIEGCRHWSREDCPGRWELLQQTEELSSRRCDICLALVNYRYTISRGDQVYEPVAIDPAAKRSPGDLQLPRRMKRP